MNIAKVVAWAFANWQNVLGLVAVVIASASVLIKALEAVVKALVAIFPGLQSADGELVKFAAWLDALAKSGWLNTMAASPKADK